jgi:hypothetical protein
MKLTLAAVLGVLAFLTFAYGMPSHCAKENPDDPTKCLECDPDYYQ